MPSIYENSWQLMIFRIFCLCGNASNIYKMIGTHMILHILLGRQCLQLPEVSRGFQRHPDASRGFQRLPEASRASRGFQRLPGVSKRFQRFPEASRGFQSFQRPPDASRGSQRFPKASRSSQWLPVVPRKLPEASRGFQRLPKASRGIQTGQVQLRTVSLWVAKIFENTKERHVKEIRVRMRSWPGAA